MLDALERVHQWRELVGIFPVHQDYLCFGMFEDIGELLGGQAEVEGISTAPSCGTAKNASNMR